MKKIICALCIGVIVSIMAAVYSNSVMADLTENLVRLHIIANSDNEYDQAIKLKVRDQIIHEVRNQPQKSMESYLAAAEQAANAVLAENNISYQAKAVYGEFAFPKKVYNNIVLPQGTYTGVEVLLGDGAGANWWCVMYPPLCFTEETTGKMSEDGKHQLYKTLNEESYQMITDDQDIEIQMKFKIVELVQQLLK